MAHHHKHMTFKPDPIFSKNAHIKTMEQYKTMYQTSIDSPRLFWAEMARQYYWKSFDDKFDFNFDVNKGSIFIKWWEGSKTNMCYNTLDRNVHERKLGETVAYYWEGNDPSHSEHITYKELLNKVCQFANVLKKKGVHKGDRVAVYMPMLIETAVAMLACARIGAIHSVIFGGFSVESLKERLLDAQCVGIITADGAYRGSKLINLKQISHEAVRMCKKEGLDMKFCVTFQNLSRNCSSLEKSNVNQPTEGLQNGHDHNYDAYWDPEIDSWWHEEVKGVSTDCDIEWMDAEDPFFMLYTSGSTGRPKGVLHTCGGYMVYVGTTFKYVFDYHLGEIYWCTADIGWVTGHSYALYGPLLNGATSVIFEGTPFHPHPGRYWEIVSKYKVNKLYTSPTAVRSLIRFGNEHVTKYDRSSLTLLGSVGEPINPEAWMWLYKTVGEERCSIVDTYWQTETGGFTIAPLPGAMQLKPGSASLPFFGIKPKLFGEDGSEINDIGEGFLAFQTPWPGIMRTVYGNHEKFEETYFKRIPGVYTTGDGAYRDDEGFYWITGRIDDMLNVSGHLMSTAEIEAAIDSHPSVAEAATVARPHPIKGQCLYCFVTLKENQIFTPELVQEFKNRIRKEIGPLAIPDYIQEAKELPKTRSGKIVRRVLKKIAKNDKELGDLSTLADPAVIDELFNNRID